MTDADLAVVRGYVERTRFRVKVITLPGGERVVAKRQRPARRAWRARLVNALARVSGLGLLQAVPAEGGAAAQAVEVRRLRSLAATGVPVPPLLHVEADFFVIGHLAGPSLVERIGRGGSDGFAAWKQGMAALLDVHRRGACLSQAFARNFIDTGSGLAMIDFEDDPLAVLTLAEAQARDWLAYLHSTVWMLDAPPAEARAAVGAALAGESAEVRRLVGTASRRLAALRHLPRSRRAFGREIVGAQAMASLFPVPATAADPAS